MAFSVIIGLILLGIILILVEIFFTPGFVIGLVGAAAIVVGLVNTYTEYGYTTGNFTLIGVLIFLGTVIVLAFKNGIWNRFAIADVIEGKANNVDQLIVNVGDTGEALSALRPAGTAIIGNQKMEVHTEGSFLLAKDKLVVTKILNKKIFVELIKQQP